MSVPPSQKVHVRGFPAHWSDAELREFLSAHVEPVKSVTLIAATPPFAFATVSDESSAQQFVSKAQAARPATAGRAVVCSAYRESGKFKVPLSLQRQVSAQPLPDADAAFFFRGPTEAVAHHHAAMSALARLERESLLGFDTETRPQFRRGEAQNLPALVQLSTRDSAFVFSLQHLSATSLDRLLTLLGDARVLKAGVNVRADAAGLVRRYPQLRPAGFLKLEQLAPLAGVADRGLESLARRVLDLQLAKHKSITLSDWNKWPLAELQLLYAATDAWVGCAVAFQLLATLQLSVDDLVAQNPNHCLTLHHPATSTATAAANATATTTSASSTADEPKPETTSDEKDTFLRDLRRRRLRRKAWRTQLLVEWANKTAEELEAIWNALPPLPRGQSDNVHVSDATFVRTQLHRVVDAQTFHEDNTTPLPPLPPKKKKEPAPQQQ